MRPRFAALRKSIVAKFVAACMGVCIF